MKKLIVPMSLAALATLAVSTPPVHAGGGMGPGAGVTTCRLVTGAPNQFQVVKVQDDYLSATTADTVVIGTLSLICDIPATGQTQNPIQDPNNPNIQFTTGQPVGETEQNSMTCYTVGRADNAKFPTTVTDAFSRTFQPTGTYDVTLGAINLVCVPAIKSPPPAP